MFIVSGDSLQCAAQLDQTFLAEQHLCIVLQGSQQDADLFSHFDEGSLQGWTDGSDQGATSRKE